MTKPLIPKSENPTDRRDQDHVVRQPGVLADQRRPQQVVDEADEAGADPDQDHALHVAGQEKVARDRRPDDRRAHAGNSDRNTISVPQSSAASMPSAQKVTPPIGPG